MALGDQAGKQAVDELVAQLPALESFLRQEREALQASAAAVIQSACGSIATTQDAMLKAVGEALAAITAERQEAIAALHGVLDRLQVQIAIRPKAE